ncbi:MAG TPA: glycosyltransferase [Actinomycetota bacterium]
MTRVSALVPARDEAERIAATVAAVAGLPGVERVLVVDDASGDATGEVALAAGAAVIRLGRRLGKGGAMEAGLRRGAAADVWLLVDGDLGETAGALAPVLDEVIEGRAELAIALPPPQEGGGFGLVKGFAAWAIRVACGFESAAPLSGQRAIGAAALDACRPLAAGFGVETAMTIDAVRAGFRVVEVPAPIRHRPTGRGLRGFAHRARQGLAIAAALAPRLSRMR